MAQTGDVAARLDEGQAAVETFAEFVWACGLLGYRHPDLTAHLGQVHDWYSAEDGLDLRALDADGAALAATAGSAEQALRLQDDQLSALSQAWQGRGAQAAREFLLRHGGAAQQAVVAVRRAADTVAALRDQLWRAVDDKVAVTERIEARCAAQRELWLAAARTVRTGLGNRDAASELVDAQIKPFVDNDIGGEWVSAMRSASTAVSDAYASAITALTDGPAPVFEIPGDLGPSWTPHARTTIPADPPVGSAGTVPAGFVPSGRSDPAPWVSPVGPVSMAPLEPQIAAAAPPLGAPAAEPTVPVAPAAAPAASDPTAGWSSPLGGGLPGAGMAGIGSGLSGIGQQLADLFGGLIGSSTDGSSGLATDTALPAELDEPDAADAVDDVDHPEESDDPDADDSEDPDHPADDEKAEDVEAVDDTDTDTAADAATTEGDVAELPVPVDGAVEPVETAPPTPPTIAPPVAAPPPAEPVAAPAKTPCEIAADELPQVGG
jgi:hypothetical protein